MGLAMPSHRNWGSLWRNCVEAAEQGWGGLWGKRWKVGGGVGTSVAVEKNFHLL